MRIRNLDVGVERITRWETGDEVHLPPEGKVGPAFLPQYRPLDAILSRPSLDERLPDLLQPVDLDPDLIEPTALTDVRRELAALFGEHARAAAGPAARALAGAAALLHADGDLDEEVRKALAALLRG